MENANEYKFSFVVSYPEEIINFKTITFKNFYSHSVKVDKIYKDLQFYFIMKNSNSLEDLKYHKTDDEIIKNLFDRNDSLKTFADIEAEAISYFNNSFFKIFEFSHLKNIFFKWCSSSVYINTFEFRFEEFKKYLVDIEILDFIKSEYKSITYSYAMIEDSKFIDHRNLLLLIKSRNEKIKYLEELLRHNNIKVKVNWGEKNMYELFYLDFIEENEITSDEDDATLTEKIIYLKKLGIIDFLKLKQPFASSTNQLANILSRITDGKKGTIQSMINPMFNKKIDDRNNPLNSKKAVESVENQLIKIGFKLDESI